MSRLTLVVMAVHCSTAVTVVHHGTMVVTLVSQLTLAVSWVIPLMSQATAFVLSPVTGLRVLVGALLRGL